MKPQHISKEAFQKIWDETLGQIKDQYCADYPSVKIGKGNPYYKCAACGVSDPEINGRLEGHRNDCEWMLNVFNLL